LRVRTALIFVVVVSFLGLGLAGCGGGKPNASATAALLQEEYGRSAQASGWQPIVVDVRCGPGQAGWDYVCTYQDTANGGRKKLGAHLHKSAGHWVVDDSGSRDLKNPLPRR
jgi:hypothetical protein